MYVFNKITGDETLKKLGIHDDNYRIDYEKLATDLNVLELSKNETGYYKLLRIVCKEDFFAFCYFLLGLPVNTPFLHARCKEAQNKRHLTLDLWSREHWKSSILTYALPIWEVIQQKEERVVIFSHTRTLAKSHLRRIKHTLQENRKLIHTFPDIFYMNPEGESPKWSEEEGLYVKRSITFPEATFEAWGLIDSSPIGKHWSIMVFDDLVTEKSVSTADQIRKATDAFKLAQNLGTRNGIRRVIGTRYSHKDSYSEIIANRKWTTRVYPAEVDDAGKAKRGGIPVMLTTSELDEKYELMGEYIYSSQMLQNPTAESMQGFKEFWLKYWQKNRPYMNHYCIVDPAQSKKKDSDYTVMVVIGTDSNRNYWLVDMVRDKLNLKEKWEKLKGLVTTWGLNEVCYEKSGLSTDGEYFQQMMEEEGFFFNIKDLNRKSAKSDRIKRLVPLFQKGRFILPRSLVYEDILGKMHDLTQEFVEEEYLFFPYSKHDDCLDAMSSILDSEIGVTFPTRVAIVEENEMFNDPFNRGSQFTEGSWMAS